MMVFARILRWFGLATFVFGLLGSAWATVMFVQVETGWGISEIQRCCSDYAKSALALVLSSMFFVLSGAGLLLITRPLQARLGRTTEPWFGALALLLIVYGLGSIGLATALAGNASDLDGAAPGIVSYCMLAGVGSFVAAWGMKRATRV